MMNRTLYLFLASVFISGCTGGSSAARSDDQWANYRANALYERAEEYYSAGRYAEAINDYSEYLDKYRDLHKSDDASFRIAQSLEVLGQRMEAADAYRATGMAWYRSSLAPNSFLRAGELYEIEGWLRDAKLDYERASEYTTTEAGQTGYQRLEAVKKRIAEEEALRKERRRSGGSDEERNTLQTSNLRQWPPPDRTMYDLITRK